MRRITDLAPNIKTFLKGHGREYALPLIVFMLALASFGLGRLSAIEEVRPPVSIVQAAEETAPRAMYMGGDVVASRTGAVFYFPWCSGASKILPANQRWFKDEKAAQAAGYRAAKNCKGLTNQ